MEPIKESLENEAPFEMKHHLRYSVINKQTAVCRRDR